MLYPLNCNYFKIDLISPENYYNILKSYFAKINEQKWSML